MVTSVPTRMLYFVSCFCILLSAYLIFFETRPIPKRGFKDQDDSGLVPEPNLPTIVDYGTAWEMMDLGPIRCSSIEAAAPVGVDLEQFQKDNTKLQYICPGSNLSSDLLTSLIRTHEYQAFSKIWWAAAMYPNLLLLDIGANMGTTSIPLANAFPTLRVIAIEPLKEVVRLLTKSVLLNGLQDRYTILNNAVSDQPFQTVRMISQDARDMTLNEAFKPALSLMLSRMDTPVVVPPIGWKRELDKFENTVRTVTFDELLPLARGMVIDQCVLKVDVEGAECLAVQKIEQFLMEVSVPLIVMETDKIASADSACVESAFDLLAKCEFIPYTDKDENFQEALDPKDFKSWFHRNTLWVRKGTEFFDKIHNRQ